MDAKELIKPILSRKKLPDIRPGDIVRVHERVREGNRMRTAIFEGLVIARRHGSEPGATITVRKISYGVGVERVFPLFAPTIEKFEVVRRAKVRRAKLHYIRKRVGKLATIRGEILPPATGTEESEEQEASEEGTSARPSDETAGA
jgi:large subunit ribosomal protein L19